MPKFFKQCLYFFKFCPPSLPSPSIFQYNMDLSLWFDSPIIHVPLILQSAKMPEIATFANIPMGKKGITAKDPY